jgi:hypothetical protein
MCGLRSRLEGVSRIFLLSGDRRVLSLAHQLSRRKNGVARECDKMEQSAHCWSVDVHHRSKCELGTGKAVEGREVMQDRGLRSSDSEQISQVRWAEEIELSEIS